MIKINKNFKMSEGFEDQDVMEGEMDGAMGEGDMEYNESPGIEGDQE